MGRIDSALITLAERLYYVPHRRAHVIDWLATVLSSSGVTSPGDVASAVLDFGGGTGRVAAELVGRLGATVVVADVDAAALARVPASDSLRRVLIPPEPPLPFRDGVFGAVLLIDVLHHLRARSQTLSELARVLRPDGVLAIVEFEPHRLATRLFRRFAGLGGRRCRFETRDVLAAQLADQGFAVVETVTLDGLRYGVIGLGVHRQTADPAIR